MASAPPYEYQDPPPYAADPNSAQSGVNPPLGQPLSNPAHPPPYTNPPQNPSFYPAPLAVNVGYFPQTQPVTAASQSPPYGVPQTQTSVIYVNANNPTTATVQQVPYESFAGYIAFSCLVLWCFNPLFGFIAFILASKQIPFVAFSIFIERLFIFELELCLWGIF
jgi:hypothetical protein